MSGLILALIAGVADLNTAFLSVIAAGLTPFMILTVLLLGISFHVVAWQPPELWTTQFGSRGTSEVWTLSGKSGGLYAAGFLNGDVGGYLSTPFVASYDFNGHAVWNQSFAKNYSHPSVNAIAVDTEGVYVSGLSSDVGGLVEKYYLNGSIAWLVQSMKDATSVSVNTNGIYAAGYNYVSYVNYYSYFLRTYDFNGNIVSTSFLANSTQEQDPRVFSDSNGVYVTGINGTGTTTWSFLQRYGSDGTLRWSAKCTCGDSISTDASGVYVLGRSAVVDGVLSKFGWNGNQLWSISIAPPDRTGIARLQVSADSSGIYMAMASTSGYLMRYDGNGNQVWSFRVPRMLNSVWAGQSGVFVGGGMPGAVIGGLAFISEYSTSSSLILFGVNPPWSLAIVAGLGGIAVLSILWFRRQRRRRPMRPRSTAPRPSSRPSEDQSPWVKKPR